MEIEFLESRWAADMLENKMIAEFISVSFLTNYGYGPAFLFITILWSTIIENPPIINAAAIKEAIK